MSLLTALGQIDAHRDIVPIYYLRSQNKFVIAGVQRTNGGAFVLDSEGRQLGFHASKKAALAALSANEA